LAKKLEKQAEKSIDSFLPPKSLLSKERRYCGLLVASSSIEVTGID
jgi:hypothetical protein